MARPSGGRSPPLRRRQHTPQLRPRAQPPQDPCGEVAGVAAIIDDIVEPAVIPAGLRVKTGVADMSLSIFNIDNSSQAPIRARTFVNRVSAAVKIGDLVQRTHRRLARTPTEAGCRTVAR